MNEKGVSVSATVSTSSNDNVKAADPLVDTGICEISLTSVILMSAESARDGVEKLADLIDTYGSTGFGNGQYFRYWQGVNYLNEELSETISVERDGEAAPEGPFNMLFEADHQLTTYEVLRLLACRGEGTQYAADNNPENNPNGTAIGNERQAECHVFEIRSDMPEELATIQWQTMSRAEFSVYLPYYSNLLTDTSDIFKTEYSPSIKNIEEVLDDADFPADTSAYWVFTAINDLCDNDRERYGANVKLYWEDYQKALIEQQEAVDEAMKVICAEKPEQAEQVATALAKGVSEEAFANAKSILTELWAFVKADQAGELAEDAVFTPSVLTENKMPTYSMDMAYTFDDVDASAWYADAVYWTRLHGIVTGYSTDQFAPDDNITREQLATILMRFLENVA